jgi:Uma2 family endonuclease
MTIMNAPAPRTKASKRSWDLDRFFSEQGLISEKDYLRLTESTKRLVEFTDGEIEVLPMPKISHQVIGALLFQLLTVWVAAHDGGLVLYAGTNIRIRPGKIREPDIVFIQKKNLARSGDDYWDTADLVIEIISSPEGRRRDLIEKRKDYAEGKIPEYWIVDPKKKSITVLKLQDGKYIVHSEATASGTVKSAFLKGFNVDIAPVFSAAKKS